MRNTPATQKSRRATRSHNRSSYSEQRAHLGLSHNETASLAAIHVGQQSTVDEPLRLSIVVNNTRLWQPVKIAYGSILGANAWDACEKKQMPLW